MVHSILGVRGRGVAQLRPTGLGDGVAVSARAMVRLALAGVIAATLFVMHGAAAGGGCAAGVSAMDVSPAGVSAMGVSAAGVSAAGVSAMPASMTTGAASLSGPPGSAEPVPGHIVSAMPAPEHGHAQVCVSTPPRPVLVALPQAVGGSTGTAVGEPAGSRPAVDPRSGAPPHGAGLLVMLGVSRT